MRNYSGKINRRDERNSEINGKLLIAREMSGELISATYSSLIYIESVNARPRLGRDENRQSSALLFHQARRASCELMLS